MACATLKRSYDFDPLSPSSQMQRSPKRKRCGPPVVSSPGQTSESISSPFYERTPKISSDELSASVYEEWRRIQKRQKMTDMSSTSPGPSDRMSPNKGFWNPNAVPVNMMPFNCNFSGHLQTVNSPESGSRSPKDHPMFTAKQVVMLCERLWKEREEKLRCEYEQVLHERLSEQYNAFLKFTQDQITRRYNEPTCSYVS
eukprot:Seg750.11 transcript_id=Seg750.11/GoldUCD/mRNA.D3Y31 product="putative protein C1orf108 A" protein_id=Seg750.11/GoldUCD/D3Y31